MVTLPSPLTSHSIVGITQVLVTTFDPVLPMNAWIVSTPTPPVSG